MRTPLTFLNSGKAELPVIFSLAGIEMVTINEHYDYNIVGKACEFS